jgi:long-chain acyl-CoA synthetase
MRNTINGYLDDYLKRGSETAFAHLRGLRPTRWSYARIAQNAFRFARFLEARGIRKGERVLLWAANSPEWVVAFFGCALGGAVLVPLDVESAPDFVARVGQQTKPRLLLLSNETKRRADSLDIPSLALEELEETLSRHSSDAFETTDINDDDLFEIIYTSGTTAEPRGVCLTHRNLLANLAPIEKEVQKYLRWERIFHPIRFLNLLPLSHVFGQFMGILVPQLTGGEVHFQDSLNPSEIVNTIKTRRISVVITVPRLLDSLREHVERRESARGRARDLRRKIERAVGASPLKRLWLFRHVHRYFGWKFWAFVTGGATLDADTEAFWRRLGFAVIQGYGMTETASLITVNHPFKSGGGSVGKILPGQELKLGEGGEILVRGANVSPGYWRDGATEPLSNGGGWLRTGDLGEIDDAGNIHFKGRKKEVIVTAAGLNVYPEDIEAALNHQPEILRSAVVEFKGPRGPEPLAVIIMRNSNDDPARAVERANASLARHQRVRRWHIWPESDFPRTPTQKIRKNEIIERVLGAGDWGLGDSLPGAASMSRPTSVLNGLNLPNTQLPTPNTLSSLDSLGRVELLSALEDRYQIEIDEASFTAATTVADIERIVRDGGVETDASAEYPYPTWTQRFPFTWIRVALLYAVVLPITALLCWLRVRGKDKLKNLNGPALFVSNHITYFDHALILSALPGRFRRRFAIAQEGERLRFWRRPPAGTPWHRRLRWLAQYFLVIIIFNTFSLPQKSGFRRSFAYAGETIDRGFNVLVFPEGTRTTNGRINPFKSGVGILASRLGVPVVPVRIEGLAKLKLSGRRGFAFPGTVSVLFGEPVTYAPDEDPTKITSELERRVREL